jgi:hypothetical protein
MATSQAASGQGALFGTPLPCPDIDNLPLILEPRSQIEVLAPGSVYQPLLLKPEGDRIEVGPGKLDAHEEAFVRDLIKRLYPAGNHPKSPYTPLRWGDREIWLKRNLEKREDSFRLRLDDSDWFYPDFIVWILDHANRTQTFGFVDPKGLGLGAAGGWSDYKVLSTLYMPHIVERQLAAHGDRVVYQGQDWVFRVRGVLLSTSPYANLSLHNKFNIKGEGGVQLPPTEEDFRRGRILFQRQDIHYIDPVLALLTEDSEIDHLLKRVARLFDNPASFAPSSEQEFELALRFEEHTRSETEFVAELLRDYLRPDSQGRYGVQARERRRGQLLNYTHEGLMGFGVEKATTIRDLPNPCEELWKRKNQLASRL